MAYEYEQKSFLGSGELHVDVFDDDGNPTGELDVGNASVFAITAPNTTKKKQKGFRRANYAQTIKSVTTEIDQGLRFTLTDINKDNLALALWGTAANYTQSGGADATHQDVTAHLDRWVKLSNENLDPDTPPVVKNSGGTVTYTEGTDYEIDYIWGRIYFYSGVTITEAQAIEVTATWLAITDGWKVEAMTSSILRCSLRLIGLDQANNRDVMVEVDEAEISCSGDISWLTEDYAQLDFTGEIAVTEDGAWRVYAQP